MKGLSITLAVVAGAVAGVAAGLLFAPQKGVDTRADIKKFLCRKGAKLRKNDLDKIVEEIAEEIRG